MSKRESVPEAKAQWESTVRQALNLTVTYDHDGLTFDLDGGCDDRGYLHLGNPESEAHESLSNLIVPPISRIVPVL